jgi:hypothetical protein
MDSKTLIELRQLIDRIMCAPTKKDAQESLSNLQSIASSVRGDIDPYAFSKLEEIIVLAKQASGRVNGKQHWISQVEQRWFIFKSNIERE